MGKLEQMLEHQQRLNDIIRRNEEHTPWQERMKQYALALMMESAELMDWLPWKHWSVRSGNKKVPAVELFCDEHMTEIKTEVVDCLHFLLSLALELDMTADDIFSLYVEKMEVNMKRGRTVGY